MQIQINFIKRGIRQNHSPVNFQNLEVRFYDNAIQDTDLYLAKVKSILIQDVEKNLIYI